VKRCDECEHPTDIDAIFKCEQCGVLVCDDCRSDHARECHEDCLCDLCLNRKVMAAESLRDSMEDR
jgi:hypothetical protein